MRIRSCLIDTRTGRDTSARHAHAHAMFAGHIGAALAIGRLEPRIHIGVLVGAALLLDIVLWTLILLGLESARITDDFSATHQPEFVFPYSHGLLASLVWSAVAGCGAMWYYRRLQGARVRAAMVVAAAVWSHWMLDLLVHVPEMPLAGENSLKLGLGLWQVMPAALAVEAAIVAAGLLLYLPRAPITRHGKIWLGVFTLLVLAFTIVGMTVAPPPPSAVAMAASSLATILVVCALMGWIGRRRD